MKTTKKELIVEIIIFLFVLLFLYAAGSKLIDYKAFVGQMGRSPLLTRFAPAFAYFVPIVEIVICFLLFFNRTRLIGLYASFGLMFTFTIYIITILTFSTEIPCSCGGILSKLGWKEHFVFNCFFLFIALVGITFHDQITTEKVVNKSLMESV